MVGEHRHCPCNGILLCRTCHVWVHQHPEEARSWGLIVSRHVEFPGSVPVVAHFGTLMLGCNGNYAHFDLSDKAEG